MPLSEVPIRLRVTRYLVWTVATVAAGALVWAVAEASAFLPNAPSGFWAMALAALLVDVPLFGMSRHDDLRVRSTLSVCFTFAIFMLWGGAPAIAVQALAAAVSAVGQRYHPRAAFDLVSRLILAFAAAAVVDNLTGLRPAAHEESGLSGADLLAVVWLTAVWLAVAYGLLAVARATASMGGLRQAVSEIRLDLTRTAMAVIVVVPLLTVIPGWWTLLFAAPLATRNLLNREQGLHEQRLGREPVSGLLNRQGLAEGLRTMTAGDLITPAGPRSFGIVLVTFESVLGINRMLGRELYEKVVGVASKRLSEAYGANRAARLSGEGIVVVMPDLTEADAVAEAEAVVSVLDPVIEVDDIPFSLVPVGGVALSPKHGQDLGTLLMKAELAATEARRTGQRAVLYVRRAAELAEKRVALLRELHTVLRDPDRRHEIAVLYQPQVDVVTGRLYGVEALLRWTHPQWGPMPTNEVIEAIEPTDIMHLLTQHVLAMVAAQVRRWNEQGEQTRVSVNVSVGDLHEPDFVDELGELVRKHDIPTQQLLIEITERMLISDLPRVIEVAGTLVGSGVGLSLDDFGTGYASLQQLRQVPLTEVKVDRSYVNGMVDNRADEAIVTSVHQLAGALGVDVVAEGVEDQRTADALARLGGVIGQGWHFGRPMTVENLRNWRQRQPRAVEG